MAASLPLALAGSSLNALVPAIAPTAFYASKLLLGATQGWRSFSTTPVHHGPSISGEQEQQPLAMYRSRSHGPVIPAGLGSTLPKGPVPSTFASQVAPLPYLEQHLTSTDHSYEGEDKSVLKREWEGFLGYLNQHPVIKKTLLRMKGVTRKAVLRTVNRRIVAQLARRATIAIPILGFYFVSNLAKRDLKRAVTEFEHGHTDTGRVFTAALGCELLDLMSQATIITAIAYNNFGIGLQAATMFQPYADKMSIAMACTTCLLGITGELMTILREERQAQQRMAVYGNGDFTQDLLHHVEHEHEHEQQVDRQERLEQLGGM